MSLLEIIADKLFEYRRGERAKRLALLYTVVEYILHIGAARVDNY